MDYDKQLRDIDNLIAEGMYPQAVRTAGSVLEHLYKELYRDLLGKMPPGERDAVSKQEQRIGKDRGINDFTLGMVAGLYREANLVPKLEQHLDHKLPFMRSFNPGHFIDLRNRATHANAEISVEEAQLLLGQLRVLLKEVGKVAPPRPKEPTSTAMMLKPWTQVVQPHEDIQRGELAMDTYAADLWAVYRKDPDSAGVYRDANAFFDATYPTEALHALLHDVMQVLAGGKGNRVLQLRTPFGGGKTHTLIALYHLAHSRPGLDDEAWADIPDPGTTRVAVIQGLALDPYAPRRDGGNTLHTLWGEIAWQVAGPEGYKLVEAQDKARTAPGGDVLRALLGGQPTLILMDEVLTYVQKTGGFPVLDSTLGRQTMAFMQTLTEVVRSLPHAALVYSLQASVREAAGDEALLDELDHLVSRIDAKREPVSGDEILRVVQRRLFADLGDARVRQEVAREYAALYRRLREGIGETEGIAAKRVEAELLETRILASHPFHPDLLDLMYHRWGSLPSYQRTRGALQFLATVVHALWRNGGGAQPLIGPGDVPLADDEVRGALFSQVGEREHFTSVLDADLTSTRAGVRDVDRRMAQESPALQYLRVGSRLATAAFLYSFGARTGEDQGVLENELITAALAPGLDRMVLLAALSDLRKNLLYLHHTSGRYLFKTAPNLNKLIGDEAAKFSAKDVLARVRTALEAQLRSGGRGVLCWPEDSAAIPEREPVFRVAYLDLEWAQKADAESVERDLRHWFENRGNAKREYLNALAFATPSRAEADAARKNARQLLAIESLLRQTSKYQFSNEQKDELEERRRNAASELDAALGQLYDRVYLPVPVREGEMAYRLEMIDLRARISGVHEIHGRILDALRTWVFDNVTPAKLVALVRLAQTAGQTGQEHIGCETVVTWFFSYLDFPKLLDIHALQRCIAQGVKDEVFGYVVGAWGENGALVVENSPARVRLGDHLDAHEVDLSPGAYILSAGLARRLKTPAPETSGFITGQVWSDADADGARSDSDEGVAGVTVVFEEEGREVGRVATDREGRYVSPPLPPGQVRVSLAAQPDCRVTTDETVARTVRAQDHVEADFGVSFEEVPPSGQRYRLRIRADKTQTFTVFRVLQNLSDRADRMTVTFEIEAETEGGFDPIWLRNAVEEPLDEADILGDADG